MTKQSLKLIKEVYEKGGNIIQHLKGDNTLEQNSDESIMVSYDFQAGSYIEAYKNNPATFEKYTDAIAKVINELDVECTSLCEVGVGEATTLACLLPKLRHSPRVYGFDLAWSRCRYAINHLQQRNIQNCFIFMGDIFDTCFADSSIDLVYTSHSIEPNGGREKEAITELMRITKKYLILLEPAYDLADAKARQRMDEHGYIKNLYSSAVDLGFNVIEYRLFGVSVNPLNPTGLLIIEKDPYDEEVIENPLVCPITKTPITKIKDSYFTKEGLLAYPSIDGVFCLMKHHAVVATHYADDMD